MIALILLFYITLLIILETFYFQNKYNMAGGPILVANKGIEALRRK
jgi:hypothetical protein